MKPLEEMTTKELRANLSEITGKDYTSKNKKFYLRRLADLKPVGIIKDENIEKNIEKNTTLPLSEELGGFACKIKMIKGFDEKVDNQLARIYKETDGKAIIRVRKLHEDLRTFNQNGPLKNCLVVPWECLVDVMTYSHKKEYKK